MHYSTKRRVMLGMTTGGLLMTGLGITSAHADTTATGETSQSPGIGSGNLIQLPVNAPINVCGNQIDVIGILDSVTGNSCANGSTPATTGTSGGSTSASGTAKKSPDVGSGNLIQVPVNAPINVCGNQIDVVGVGNTDRGNSCANNGSGSTTARGSSHNSPGIGSGNLVQLPVNAPINVCGNQIDVIGILDSVTGNSCANNAGPGVPTPPPSPTPTGCNCPPPPPPSTPCPPSGTATATSTSTATPTSSAPGGTPSRTATSTSSRPAAGGSGSRKPGKPIGVLAHTGSDALTIAPLAAGLIGGGVFLRKRFPTRSH